MRVTFIQPRLGAKPGERYPQGWRMEPLWAATLAALTPASARRDFFDDRLEAIPYDHETDLVAISVETYTARRAYGIAGRFRERSVPVVLGGFHVTLDPDEGALHADSVVVGQAETVWAGLLEDLQQGRLRRRYDGPMESAWSSPQPDSKPLCEPRLRPASLGGELTRLPACLRVLRGVGVLRKACRRPAGRGGR